MKLEEIIRTIEPLDQATMEKARQHTSQLIMPPRALGELNDIGEKICSILRTLKPSVKRKAVVVMAGDHGVAGQGVSAFPQEVTGEMVKAFIRGGASINVLARHTGSRVLVVDMGIIPDLSELVADTMEPANSPRGNLLITRKIGRGTKDFTQGPAMTVDEAQNAILVGFDIGSALFEQGLDLLGTGDMGIGNTSPSSAIGSVITGHPVERMTGRGTGVDDEGFARKCDTIRKGITVNRPDPTKPLDVLSKVGGFELGGIAGLVLAAAYHKKPVVIDGLISTAGALVAHVLCPEVKDYMFAGHQSVEQGHRLMLEHLGLNPLLDIGMRLGEGTGGVLAMHIIEAGVKIFREVLTFEQAAVSESDVSS